MAMSAALRTRQEREVDEHGRHPDIHNVTDDSAAPPLTTAAMGDPPKKLGTTAEKGATFKKEQEGAPDEHGNVSFNGMITNDNATLQPTTGATAPSKNLENRDSSGEASAGEDVERKQVRVDESLDPWI